MEIEQYNYYEAEVRVKNRATLKPEANVEDGMIVKVQAAWIIEEGAYKGQWAMIRMHELWLPEEDLIVKKEITFREYFTGSAPPLPLTE